MYTFNEVKEKFKYLTEKYDFVCSKFNRGNVDWLIYNNIFADLEITIDLTGEYSIIESWNDTGFLSFKNLDEMNDIIIGKLKEVEIWQNSTLLEKEEK